MSDQPTANVEANVEEAQVNPSAIAGNTEEQPNLLFTTKLLWDNGQNETIMHISPPKFVDDFIQFSRSEDIVMLNKHMIRKATTSVQVLKAENGHSRIIT